MYFESVGRQHHLHVPFSSLAPHLHVPCTSLAHVLHVPCTLLSRPLYITCTSLARPLHITCTSLAPHLLVPGISLAPPLHITCASLAPHLHVPCTSPQQTLATTVLHIHVSVIHWPQKQENCYRKLPSMKFHLPFGWGEALPPSERQCFPLETPLLHASS